LSGAGGNLGIALLLKTQPIDIRGTVEDLLGITGTNELDIYHPVMTLVQTFVESADPLNYAGALIYHPPAGQSPKQILMTEGLGDTYTPNGSAEALAVALGVNPAQPLLEPVEGLSYLARQPLPPPVTGNAMVSAGATVTAVLAQYPAVAGQEGHYVVYWNPTARKQYGEFLRTVGQTGMGTFVAP
jgi:hypothetical protein